MFNSRSNLIGVTYISHWSTHWTAHNIPDAPTKRYFFYKKITQSNARSISHLIIWLALKAGKMTQIARCDWLSHLVHLGLPAVSHKKNFPQKPYNKSYIDQVCCVKMAGYWRRSFFVSLWTSTSSRSIHVNMQKRTWSIFSHLDLTLGQ